MIAVLRRRIPASGRERGSISIWLATTAFVMIILVGLAADLTGQVHAQQRARDVAAQAARAGGQQVQASQAIRGQGAQADATAATAAARAYLAAANVSGTVAFRGGDTVVVNTTTTYETKFLSLIGLNQMTVSGTAESRIVRAVGGVEQ